MADRAPTGPRRFASGTDSPSAVTERVPVVALIRAPSLLRWISHEFHHLEASLFLTYSSTDMAARLLTDLLPTPRLLVVSIDELSLDELMEVKNMRAQGWRGRTIAMSRSRMLPALRTALNIDRLLTPPFVQDLFADILRELAAAPPASLGALALEPSPAPLPRDGRDADEDTAPIEVAARRHAAREATKRMTTGSSSLYTATPEASLAESMPNPRTISSEVSSSIRTNRR